MHLLKHLEARLRADDDATAEALKEGRGLDLRLTLALILCAVLLTLLHDFGTAKAWKWMLPVAEALGGDAWAGHLRYVFRYAPRAELHRLLYWVAATLLFYGALPALCVRLVFKEPLADYGLRLQGFWRHAPLYGALYAAVLPLVAFAAWQPAFRQTYPFYGRAHLDPAGWIVWEAAYAAQFLALEFFFRGFLLQATRARLGWYSVLVMTIPYCMIHFGKPTVETLGAVVAGIVLGTLALWTRSIWPGVLVHVSVAWTMDLLAVWAKRGV